MSRNASDYRRWEIPGIVTFTDTPGGLVRIEITTPLATAQVYLHGAHVAAFQPAGAQPVLFMSRRSMFEKDKPIRGGVPVIFPWFGPRAGHPDAPAHGFVRTMNWDIESLTCHDGKNVTLVLVVASDNTTRAHWPHDFTLRHRITIGTALTMALEVTNRSAAPFTFEEALHTYFTISSIHDIAATGFEGADYLDKTDGAQRKKQDHTPIRITAETDRVYLNTHTTCAVEDPGMARTIAVEKSGYGKKKLPAFTGMGVAVTAAEERQSPTWVASVAEVSVDPKSGEFAINRLTIAMDCGIVVNPINVDAQIRASALWGASQIMSERLTLKAGAFEQANFNTYRPIRLDRVPAIDVHLVPTDHHPSGVGEPASTTVGPAVANAIFSATGVRVRTMPISAQAIVDGLKAKKA